MYESGGKSDVLSDDQPNNPTEMSIDTTQTGSIDNNQTDDTETIPNPERGCGHLKPGKAYFRSDVGIDGLLPAFVEFDQPIPFKEDNKRSYKQFPGIQFELSVTGDTGFTTTTPKDEITAHLERLSFDRPTGTTAGEMVSFHAHDYLLSVGKTYYETPEKFIQEAKQHGVSKGISVTSGNAPPAVNPGRTRLFLLHPKAVEVTVTETESQEVEKTEEIDLPNGDTKTVSYTETEMVDVEQTEYVPGLIGYTYLTRVVYTEDADGNVPQYIQDYEATGSLDVAKIGQPVPYADQKGFDAEGNPVDNKQEPAAIEAPTIDKMDKADLKTLTDVTQAEDHIEGVAPPENEDALYGHEGGALAVIRIDERFQKVMPSNNVSYDDDMDAGIAATTVLGPYRVTVTENGEKREVVAERTR
jgi:hypothetical protein